MIESQSASQIVDRILQMPEGTKLMILPRRAGARRIKKFKEYQAKGFQRVKVDGKIYDIDEAPR